MKYLVTGSAGVIGSSFIRYLSENCRAWYAKQYVTLATGEKELKAR